MGALGEGHGARAPTHFFKKWGYNMPCPPHFIFRFHNILVSHQAVPLTFYNKIALMETRTNSKKIQTNRQ